jgi:hypothetical protein
MYLDVGREEEIKLCEGGKRMNIKRTGRKCGWERDLFQEKNFIHELLTLFIQSHLLFSRRNIIRRTRKYKKNGVNR